MTQASSDKTLFSENIVKEQGYQSLQVLLPIPLNKKKFDYSYHKHIVPGSYVQVPFGKHKYIAVVWDDSKHKSHIDPSRLKPIEEVFDFPPMPEKHRRFLEWVSDYTMADLGSVLKLSLSAKEALEKPKKIPAYIIHPSFKEESIKLTEKRQQVLNALKDKDEPISYQQIQDKTGVSHAVIKGMVQQKILKVYSIEPSSLIRIQPQGFKKIELSEEQKKAVEVLGRIQKQDNSVTLIDGVTGSGKTEIYFELIEKALLNHQQSLVLLPEIALTEQVVKRFKDRFGFDPTLWHSNLTPAQRRDNWRSIASGQARVVIGARSALFIPYAHLKLVIIDEEHDSSYKQEEGVIYHARDMAIVKAKIEKLHVVLASATPSLETIVNCEQGKYEKITLPSRYGQAVLPDIHLVDMRQKGKNKKDQWISPELESALKENFKRKEQSLLFLNRRGYAPLTLCQSCGHRFRCESCASWLVEHKRFHRLQCHHCGYVIPKPEICPECGSIDSIMACGPGVERIVEEVRQLLPLAKIAVFSSDNMNDQEILKNTLYEITKGRVDVIVGTQMLAKGHHFPKLTLVGVIDADLGMNGGDLRASEKTYQLLQQVSGRAGRENIKGHVYIQTCHPKSKVMQALASGDRDAFIDAELTERDQADMPPFTRLTSLIFSSSDNAVVHQYVRSLAPFAPVQEDFMSFGPAEAAISPLRKQYRYRYLIRSTKNIHVQKTIDHWLSKVKKPNNVKIQIDLDPISFL